MTQGHSFELQRAVGAFSEGRYSVAEALCRRLVESDAHQAQPWFLLGMALTRQGIHDEAFRCLQTAIQITPRSAETLNALGTVANALGRDPKEAEQFFISALKNNPRCPDAHYNMGVTLQRMRQYEAAAIWYQRALVVRPDDCEAMSNLAIVFKYLNRHREGLGLIDRALTLSPQHPLAHWNRAILLLSLGECCEGFAEYEWRWKNGAGPQFVSRAFTQPRWNGELWPDQTLFVHGEQGFGDFIQFARFLPMARQRVGRIVVECPAALLPLMADSGLADEWVVPSEAPKAFDAFIPLMSLPHALGISTETLPNQVPYLRVRANGLESRSRGERLKVGLVWSGNPTHDDDSLRSIDPELLGDLVSIDGVEFHSLQAPVRPEHQAIVAQWPRWVDRTCSMTNFRATAEYLEGLDLVIAVDTAVAHLAGALGKPVWLLVQDSPDWRWLLNRADSPWYPTLRVFRQSHRGDWSPVLEQVVAELRRTSRHKRLTEA
jgi:Tfp pilus assembly protein PilF